MKHVIAIVGSRTYPVTQKEFDRLALTIQEEKLKLGYKRVELFLSEINPKQYTILSGGARGVDTWAIKIAKELGFETAVIYPLWEKYGRGAGLKRNKDIVLASDELVAFWDGQSRGTADTIEKARRYCKLLRVIGPEGTDIT